MFIEVRKLAELVKFSHTVFAFPFALAMLVVVSRTYSISLTQYIFIAAALVTARTAAMAFNRIIDAKIDALNPRTKNREIPSGELSVKSAWFLVAATCALFLIFSALLGMHCLLLAPLVLGFLFFYSWTKRFTKYSHLVLGLALSLAPGGVWYALTAKLALFPLTLMAAVLFWVGGFDILYSCQDSEFDRSVGLHSIPSEMGVARAFNLAKIFHFVAVVLLVFFGLQADLGVFYYLGIALFAYLLFSQYLIISPKDLTRIDAAFFTRNGLASLIFLVAVLLGG